MFFRYDSADMTMKQGDIKRLLCCILFCMMTLFSLLLWIQHTQFIVDFFLGLIGLLLLPKICDPKWPDGGAVIKAQNCIKFSLHNLGSRLGTVGLQVLFWRKHFLIKTGGIWLYLQVLVANFFTLRSSQLTLTWLQTLRCQANRFLRLSQMKGHEGKHD